LSVSRSIVSDLLGQKDIANWESALRPKAPERHCIAGPIKFVNVHHPPAPDAISGLGMGTHDLKLAQSVPLLRLLRAQPGTKKSETLLFNFGAVDRHPRMVADQAND
jgi:hypothetical protein